MRKSSGEYPELSPTVQDVISALPPQEPVSASQFAQEIIKRHPEYADQRAASLLPLKETRLKRMAAEWLEEVQRLYNFEILWKLSGTNNPPSLHGRLTVLGLGLLEPELRIQLEKENVFQTLIRELHEPFEEILKGMGRELYLNPPIASPSSTESPDRAPEESNKGTDGGESTKTSPVETLDSVPNQPDEPLQAIENDQLGRAAFARYLAKRIEAVPANSGAYSLHIYGPWGSGKSTLLNFIRKELEDSGGWIVAEFNAWRHQHIRPPWWSLMETVFQQTKRELTLRELLAEYWWRFNTGRADYVIGLIVLIWVLALFVFPLFHNSAQISSTPIPPAELPLKSWAAAFDSLGKIMAVILSIWGIIIAFSRSLLFGSSKAAVTYMELTRDPMNSIKERFKKLMERVGPKKRAVVFIDDLDRCQGSYVIELLEGIQTLFKDAPVVFVIAADRQWLNACYEESYQQFKSLVCEPGKPLGTLFLEKAFQFSTPVPGIPPELKEAYWQHLIQVKEEGAINSAASAREQAKDQFNKAEGESAVLRLVEESLSKPFHEQRAIREEAVVRLAAPEIVERTEHALRSFAALLDPNPRSMKRLVNTYSVNRALATLSHLDIKRDRLALWTILSLRWPLLAEFLEQNPDKINDVINNNASGLAEELAKLCGSLDLQNVMNGGPTGIPLEATHVSQCALLRM